MNGRAPLTYTPKLLTFQDALCLQDYRTIKSDLRLTKFCFERIAKREYGVVFPGLGAITDSDHFESWCIFVCGGIYYRRCFTTGVRIRFTREDVALVLDERELVLHDALIEIVNKHVAHSVNEMELGCTTLHIAVDSAGKLHRGGIGANMSSIGPLGPKGYLEIAAMTSKIETEIVEKRITTLTESVQTQLDQMSDEQILALPTGFTPFIDHPDYGKTRNWPKKRK